MLRKLLYTTALFVSVSLVACEGGEQSNTSGTTEISQQKAAVRNVTTNRFEKSN